MKILALIAALCVQAARADAREALAPTSGEIVVNSYTLGVQAAPAVATAGDGFVVVWQDERPAVEGVRVRAQRFDAEAMPFGTEFEIDAHTGDVNDSPDVVPFGEGGFLVVWRHDPGGEARSGIFGRGFDALAQPTGAEFQINSSRDLQGEYYLGAPAVAAASDGGFVVAWASGVQSTFGTLDAQVYARRFDATATATAPDVNVSGDSLGRAEVRPDVTTLAGGSFAVVWNREDLARVRVLDSAGTPVGFARNVGGGGQSGPRPIPAETSQAHVLYVSLEDDNGLPDLRGRTYDASSEEFSEEFVLATPLERVVPSLDAQEIAAAPVDVDTYVALWTSGVSDPPTGAGNDGDGAGIFARAFEADADAAGPERRVNITTAGDQLEPEVALVSEGKLAAVWSSPDAAGNRDVFARTFTLVTPECGDADENGRASATDALLSLQAAVGARDCPPCGCDVDDSGDHTAGDALLVLRAGVGVQVTLTCPLCTREPARFELESHEDCFGGIHVFIPSDVLPADPVLLSCSVDPRLQSHKCDVEFGDDENGLTLDARGCLLDRPYLFSCTGLGLDPLAMARGARVACGCGCQELCPAPVLCAEVGGECSSTGAATSSPVAQTPSTTFTTVQEVQLVSTTATSFCGTCCNLGTIGPFDIQSDVTLSELVVRVQGDADDACLFCDSPGFYQIGERDNALDFCMLAPVDLLDAPLRVTCEGHGFVEGPLEVIRARGPSFEPIDPLPEVVLSSNAAQATPNSSGR